MDTAEKNLIQLVEQLKNGDERAFATVYNQTYKYVYSRAKCMFSDEGEVQDLIQEVYLALYRNASSIKTEDSIFAWLRTTTFYQGTKMLQKKRKEALLSEEVEGIFETIPDEETQIESDYMDKEDVEVIRSCIDRLSDEQKTVLLAYYYDNLKVNEISEMLSVSEGTIKSRLFLARKNLKTHVEEEEKKRGYKLHSFGAVTLALALRAFLQTNMEEAENAEETVFAKLSQKLKFRVAKTIKVGIGAKKVIVTLIGTVVTTTVIGGAIFGIKAASTPEPAEKKQEQEIADEEEVPEESTTSVPDEEEPKEESKQETPKTPGTSKTQEDGTGTPSTPSTNENQQETPSTPSTETSTPSTEDESSHETEFVPSDPNGLGGTLPEDDQSSWSPFF